MEMPGRSFWVRAVGVPTGLALCAYLISVSHFAPSSIAVYLLLLFLLLVDITSRIPDRARTPFVVLAALVLGLCLIEGVALAFVHKPPISIQQKGLLAHDSILGWHNGNPGVYSDKRIDSNTGATIYNVRYAIDENRLRKTISSDHGPTVAFLGDSFTFGLGVKDADTMPQAFADLTDYKIRVLNLGVEGYSPAQFLRAMQTGVFDKIIGPKPSLFVFLTSPWQSSQDRLQVGFRRRRAALHSRRERQADFRRGLPCGSRRAIRPRDTQFHPSSSRFWPSVCAPIVAARTAACDLIFVLAERKSLLAGLLGRNQLGVRNIVLAHIGQLGRRREGPVPVVEIGFHQALIDRRDE